MTWGDIKINTLRKMFVNDDAIEVEALNELKNNEDYKVFLNSMPMVANEGINRIYTQAYNKYTKNATTGNYEKVIPEKITDSTADTYELEMCEECCNLLPLYMASELYKDDDITLATVYRNEFETGLNDLNTNLESNNIETIYEM